MIRFENARIDNPGATIRPQAARNRPPPLTAPPVPNIFMTTINRLTGFFRSISPNGQPAFRPAPGAGNAAGIQTFPQPVQQATEDLRLQQMNHVPNATMFTSFLGIAGQPQQQNFPVRNVRSTQNSPARQRQSPARPRRQRQPHPRRRAVANPPPVLLDDSDVEVTIVERQDGRRAEREPAREGRTNRRAQVIDLTVEADIIDLTLDD